MVRQHIPVTNRGSLKAKSGSGVVLPA